MPLHFIKRAQGRKPVARKDRVYAKNAIENPVEEAMKQSCERGATSEK
jgi:hypothetical protein